MMKLRRTALAWIATLALGLVAAPAMARDCLLYTSDAADE